MEYFIFIIICFVCIAAIASIIIYFMKRKNKSQNTPSVSSSVLSVQNDSDDITRESNLELSIQFENLSTLSEEEEKRLLDLKDKKLLAKIDSVIPEVLQAAANAGAVHSYRQAAQATGQLYQVIIPKGAVLANSKAMEGAKRGFYHGVNGIQGQANLVAADANLGSGLAAMNIANAAMGVAAMVVGQYNMTQINNRLDSISDGIDKSVCQKPGLFRQRRANRNIGV